MSDSASFQPGENVLVAGVICAELDVDGDYQVQVSSSDDDNPKIYIKATGVHPVSFSTSEEEMHYRVEAAARGLAIRAGFPSEWESFGMAARVAITCADSAVSTLNR